MSLLILPKWMLRGLWKCKFDFLGQTSQAMNIWKRAKCIILWPKSNNKKSVTQIQNKWPEICQRLHAMKNGGRQDSDWERRNRQFSQCNEWALVYSWLNNNHTAKKAILRKTGDIFKMREIATCLRCGNGIWVCKRRSLFLVNGNWNV